MIAAFYFFIRILTMTAMGVGRGGRVTLDPLDFQIISKKKQISPLLAPPGKHFGKFPYWPPVEKILPTPMMTA